MIDEPLRDPNGKPTILCVGGWHDLCRSYGCTCDCHDERARR